MSRAAPPSAKTSAFWASKTSVSPVGRGGAKLSGIPGPRYAKLPCMVMT